MRLKSIKIFGFKSFADKVNIDVDESLVAVTGPNGCGKSNIVDAIMWALGESSPKNLRAQASTDVIFAGSAFRKPLGYAEVSLVFDNEEGALPIDTSEVVVTRRVDRKGESGYSINRHSCRLKDIYELFADTGLGRTGYAIVSQKEIDAALSAPPTERRVWLDEAAGVQRYRVRKTEALKRLESALQHLQRVTDVINEIETQREPLREQAEAAKVYKQALGSLREVESGLLLKEAADLHADIARLEIAIRERRNQAESMRGDAVAADKRGEELTAEIAGAEAEIERLRENLQTAVTALERSQSKRALAEQRLHSLEQLESDSGREDEAAQMRLARLKHALESAKRELEEEARSVEILMTVISGSESDAREMSERLEAAEAALGNARHAELRKLQRDAQLAQAFERSSLLTEELAGAEAALPDLKKGSDEAAEALETAKTALQEARDEAKAVGGEREKAADEQRRTDQRRRETLAQKAALEGRIQGLRATIESFEGLPAGARAVLQAAKGGRLGGDFVPMANALHVKPEHAQAIEAALGSAAGDLITSNSKHAKAAIEFLKREGLGRATFLARDLLKPPSRPHGIDKLVAKGAIGIAADMVGIDAAHRDAVEMLLGGVVVVEDIDVATRLAKEQGFRKIVSLQGEIVFGGGALAGGRSAKQAAGPIRVAAQLEEAEAKLEKLSATEAELTAQAETIARAEEEQAKRLAAIREKIHEREVEVADAVHWVTAVKEEYAATERSVAKLQRELEALEAEVAELGDTNGDAEHRVEELEAERNTLLGLAAAKSADAGQAKRALGEAKDREAAARQRLAHAETELDEWHRHQEKRKERVSNLDEERESQRRLKAEAEAEMMSHTHERDEAEETLKLAMLRRRELAEETARSNEDAKAWREAARSLDDAAYADDISRARAETKRAGFIARLLEEYNITEEEAAAQAPLVDLPPDAQRVATRLRREIRELGDVNIGAIDAYEALTERYETLHTQREDILASKAELDKSVAELDRLTRGAFRETFEKVNEAFGEMFTFLFEGGDATLILTEPENILETGVDIEVTIPGKKKQRLELLSGGERALSACAFLFALFKVKPSPLCVLDELDAPLDGRNVERYVDLLKQFSKTSQFLVITHNPTTIEAMPLWLGVSLVEPGVSGLVPYRLPQGLPEPERVQASRN